ncbi:DUF6263 family protein [Aequorivita sp. KMM 9714]|uniref:DUF6263 family protein n=1 Tax=Aequorivita sp. KMM 9714 TaxID=2707173 RepID=UPI0013E9EDBD|nr:DUF6263 family protein [Aequorivita sp. KMM 9714]NGX84918.1 hypothetical protein [Aequorivita sp. KMM 9714]
MKSIYYLVFFLSFVSLYNVAAQEKLQYNFKKGDVFMIEQNAIQNITQNIDDSEHLMTNTVYGIFKMEVVNVLGSKFVLDVNFETFKLKIDSNLYGALSDIDTSIPANDDNVEAKIFEGLVGPKFQMVLLPTGEIESITGTENLVEGMINNVEDIDDFTKAMMRKSVEKEFNNHDMVESMQQFTFIYPEKSVKTNETWENTYTGDFTANNTWKLMNYSKTNINLESDAIINLNTTEDSVIMELSGNQKTKAVTKTATGFIETMTVTQQLEGVSIALNMNNIEIPTTLTSTITYKSL